MILLHYSISPLEFEYSPPITQPKKETPRAPPDYLLFVKKFVTSKLLGRGRFFNPKIPLINRKAITRNHPQTENSPIGLNIAIR